jgi:lysozyme
MRGSAGRVRPAPRRWTDRVHLRRCAGGPPGATLSAWGPDVSHWHPVTSWSDLVASGASLFAAKATEGDGNTDPAFAAHQGGARAQPFTLCVWYHLARQGDPQEQAKRFLDVVGPLGANERLALDTERSSYVDARWINAFFDELPSDRRPILYTSNAVWAGMGYPPFPRASGVDLWLPRYGSAAEPVIPPPWDHWTFWQHTQGAEVPGIQGPCDCNVFRGELADLQAYAVG